MDMTDTTLIAELADRLRDADRSSVPIEPPTRSHPGLGVDDAYAIQTRNIDRRGAEFGTGLCAGDVVLPGALHRMVTVTPGDVLRAEFAHRGAVTARFSGSEVRR